MLDLHGLPGSQNGAQASGCVTSPETEKGGHGPHFFNGTTNMNIALRAVDAMAKRCKEAGTTCQGIEPVNEPQPNPGQSKKNLVKFLDTYYDAAIRKIRETLPMDKPVVLFSWKNYFKFWSSDDGPRFDESTYGTIMWDTHLYPKLEENRKDADYVVSVYTDALE